MMKLRFFVKFIVISVFCLIVLEVSNRQVYAEESKVIDRLSWGADETLTTFKPEYSLPTAVVVVPLRRTGMSANSEESVRELYYYFTTRSDIGDLPFHYLVGWDGKIFFGNKLGDEAKIQLSAKEQVFVIGYIQDYKGGITVASISPLKDLLLSLINKYAINPDNISVKKLTYTLGDNARLGNAQLADASFEWDGDFLFIKENIKKGYVPAKRNYKLEVVSVTTPQEELEPSKNTEIKIKLKNTGGFNFYSDPLNTFFIVKNNPFDGKSLFYLSSDWASLSRISLLKEGERFVVGEEKEFSFKVYVPLFPPEKSEDFILADPSGNQIPGTNFKVALKIKKLNAQIIEITESSIGYVNVRATPGNSAVVTKVIAGERFIVKDYKSGYYKIEANGKEGWVINMFAKVIHL
jgi:hypothetical protein